MKTVEANTSEENILRILNFSQSENSWSCTFQCLYQWYFSFCKKLWLYNYADDNTLPKYGTSLAAATKSLEEDGKSLISWFSSNKMQANTEKFQAIAIGNKTHKQNIAFNLNGNNIKCDEEVNY